jgi:hypothetical protein
VNANFLPWQNWDTWKFARNLEILRHWKFHTVVRWCHSRRCLPTPHGLAYYLRFWVMTANLGRIYHSKRWRYMLPGWQLPKSYPQNRLFSHKHVKHIQGVSGNRQFLPFFVGIRSFSI